MMAFPILSSLTVSLTRCGKSFMLEYLPIGTSIREANIFNIISKGKFGDFVEKSHARIYATQTKDWFGKPELDAVKAALEQVP